MSLRYMLDTNICIYIHRKKPKEVFFHFAKLKPGDAVISVVTWGELLFGAQKSQKTAKVLQVLEEFITLIPVSPIPKDAGKFYGQFRSALERKGTPIGNNDLWIAAHAKALGVTLITNNEREFKRIPGLKVQNWAA